MYRYALRQERIVLKYERAAFLIPCQGLRGFDSISLLTFYLAGDFFRAFTTYTMAIATSALSAPGAETPNVVIIFTDDQGYADVGVFGAKGFTTPNRLTYAMRDMNLGRGTTPHCWRTTFSTWANENGYRPDAIERQLAHVESNKVRATYNKALLLDQRRTLLQDWADYLGAAEGSGTA